MGEMYSVQFSAVAVTAAQDFFELSAHAAKPLILHALFLSQASEVGDAQEEFLSILIKRGQTVSGSGGASPTPVPITNPSAVASFTAEVNNTVKAGTGTIVTLHADTWNERAPFAIVWTPETRPVIPGGGRGTVECVNAPADAVTISGTLYVEEVG